MTSTPWWQSDAYTEEAAVSPHLLDEDLAGPKGLALVRAWPTGMTDPGWGLVSSEGDGFMPRYMRGEFNSRRVLYGYERDKWAFAFVMRSLRLVCIDIDGKNGGLEHAKKLGMLPFTMAETSKSGDGYHLFYLTDEEWNPSTGYGQFGDRIGLEQGVDIRGTGCVYHHKQQRWNDKLPVLLPDHLKEALLHRDQKINAQNQRIVTILNDNDPLEVLLMQDQLITDLAQPIPAGKRNNTLFAIGSQMLVAQIEDWEGKVLARADELGLPPDEGQKLVDNISRYGAAHAAANQP